MIVGVLLIAFVLSLAGSASAALAPSTETVTAAATVGGEKVNINTAPVKELMTLTGVGQKVAEKIVEYREAHGPFKNAEEIRKVDGIGGGLWQRNKDRIVVK